MKPLELSHDIIAKKVWERLPEIDKQLQAVKKSLEQRQKDWKEGKGSFLGEKELAAWEEPIQRLRDSLGKEVLKYIKDSETEVKRKAEEKADQDRKDAQRQLFKWIALIAIVLTGFAFIQWNIANKQRKMADSSKEEAFRQKNIADKQKGLAENNLLRAQQAEDTARQAQQAAEEQRELAEKASIRATAARRDLEKATMDYIINLQANVRQNLNELEYEQALTNLKTTVNTGLKLDIKGSWKTETDVMLFRVAHYYAQTGKLQEAMAIGGLMVRLRGEASNPLNDLWLLYRQEDSPEVLQVPSLRIAQSIGYNTLEPAIKKIKAEIKSVPDAFWVLDKQRKQADSQSKKNLLVAQEIDKLRNKVVPQLPQLVPQAVASLDIELAQRLTADYRRRLEEEVQTAKKEARRLRFEKALHHLSLSVKLLFVLDKEKEENVSRLRNSVKESFIRAAYALWKAGNVDPLLQRGETMALWWPQINILQGLALLYSDRTASQEQLLAIALLMENQQWIEEWQTVDKDELEHKVGAFRNAIDKNDAVYKALAQLAPGKMESLAEEYAFLDVMNELMRTFSLYFEYNRPTRSLPGQKNDYESLYKVYLRHKNSYVQEYLDRGCAEYKEVNPALLRKKVGLFFEREVVGNFQDLQITLDDIIDQVLKRGLKVEVYLTADIAGQTGISNAYNTRLAGRRIRSVKNFINGYRESLFNQYDNQAKFLETIISSDPIRFDRANQDCDALDIDLARFRRVDVNFRVVLPE